MTGQRRFPEEAADRMWLIGSIFPFNSETSFCSTICAGAQSCSRIDHQKFFRFRRMPNLTRTKPAKGLKHVSISTG